MKTLIEMARIAGVRDDGHRFEFSEYEYLERFAALVAAAAVRETSAEYRMGWNDGQINEREACAGLCYQLVDNSRETRFAAAIRARSNI